MQPGSFHSNGEGANGFFFIVTPRKRRWRVLLAQGIKKGPVKNVLTGPYEGRSILSQSQGRLTMAPTMPAAATATGTAAAGSATAAASAAT